MLKRCAPLIIGAMFAFAQQGNAAEVEFCPATIAHVTAFHAPPDDKSPAYADPLFGVTLQALRPRPVAAHLVLATQNETYSATLPQLAFKAVKRHFLAAGRTVNKTSYETAPVFIRFDRPTPVRYVWVDQASAGGEKPVGCPTQPASNDRSAAHQPFPLHRWMLAQTRAFESHCRRRGTPLLAAIPDSSFRRRAVNPTARPGRSPESRRSFLKFPDSEACAAPPS